MDECETCGKGTWCWDHACDVPGCREVRAQGSNMCPRRQAQFWDDIVWGDDDGQYRQT